MIRKNTNFLNDSITVAYDSYWKFAAERLEIYYRRLTDPTGPWTDDPVMSKYRFTNTFRASDRVSQYLIKEVQYGEDRSQSPTEVFFRTLLFKIFNKIETWNMIENQIGPISWQSIDLNQVTEILDNAISRGQRIYSAAYIMPSPNFGYQRKHANHLRMLAKMIDDGLPNKISRSSSLAEVFGNILPYPGIGAFLAFQYTIDLNYSTLIDFDESSFVVAGPGALDGIAKCFSNFKRTDAENTIYEMVDRQENEFKRLGLEFKGLFGRRLQPIDCQNLFCEISKYARVAHPEINGLSGRTRIKQNFDTTFNTPIALPFFPPKWGLISDIQSVDKKQIIKNNKKIQLQLF